MISERNWGLITSGASFESLATTLVFFEDPGTELFGRRGPDGGQDARSSDRKRVFQAKHHQDGTAANAIADAKKEAKKVAKYRTPGHSREPQWRGVTHWRLVTNAVFNPTDKQTWDSVIVPLFQAQGLTADYWDQANLNALLDKHPEVDRAYFQNETRAFLSLPEVKEMLPLREPFLRRDALGAFFGREDEIRSIKALLDSNHLFLVVHGPGGVGKTRVVIEAGERVAAEGGWQVLWANVASIEASGTWFEAIVPERPTLLIVDEPEDEQVLRVLAEQLGTKLGRASQWKIVISVRSPKNPVLKFLFNPRMNPRVDQLCITILPKNDAEAMCRDLLGSGTLVNSPEDWRANAAKVLAKRFSSHPIWLTLAVHLLETTGDLAKVPQTAEGLAEQYLSEVISRQSDYPPETVLALLRWVALVGTLNRENDEAIELIASQTRLNNATAVRTALASLVNRRALIERGARNRFAELKPDVLRDHLLLKWLSVDVGFGANPVQPSEEATLLVATMLQASFGGELNSIDRAILTSLARTELVLGLSGQDVPLLDPFMEGLQKGIGAVRASTKKAIAEAFVDIAAYRPEDTVKLSQLLRGSPCPIDHVESIFGSREIGYDDVLLELAWPVFHAAFGARTSEMRKQVLTELCEIAEEESKVATRLTHGLINNGKHARDLIGRTIEGGPQFWSDFEDAVLVLGAKFLDEAADRAPSTSRTEVLKVLLEPAVSIERRQTWDEGYTVHIQTSMIIPGHPAWNTREILKAKIKEILERDETPQGTRRALWPLFAEAHRSVNFCLGRVTGDVQVGLQKEMLTDLNWALSVLTRRAGDLNEVSAARELWNWHAQYEKDPELRKIALDLETLYLNNEVAAEFEGLLSWDERGARGDRAAEKATVLARSGSPAIDEFLERAKRFFRNDQELSQVFNIAWELGRKADESEGVREFIFTALRESYLTPRANFAVFAGNSWVTTRRQSNPTRALTLAVDLVGSCGSDEQKVNLLVRLYGQPYNLRDLGKLADEEFIFIRSHERLFLDLGRASSFISCIGWGLDFEWGSLKVLIVRLLDNAPDDQIAISLSTLVEVIYWALHERVLETIPLDLGVWMLDQLLRVHDIDNLGGNLEWHISEVLKRTGKAPLTWLKDALSRRRDLEVQYKHGNVRALSFQINLSGFVVLIGQEGDIDEDSRAAVSSLLDFVLDEGSIGYYLNRLLRDIDPYGRVVPEEVARRLSQTDIPETVRRLARIGGGYVIGTVAWRVIAKPVLDRAAKAELDERRSLYSVLMDHRIQAWTGRPGEVPAMFTRAVESARQRFEAETDNVFRPYWEWRLAVAEAELRDMEESAKEERGE